MTCGSIYIDFYQPSLCIKSKSNTKNSKKIMEEDTDSRKQARLAILELANMISVPMSLNAVVRLNVADAIWEGGSNAPLTAAQILARVIPTGKGDAENLQRVLRMLASYGVFEEVIGGGERKYSLTDVGKTLVTDEEGLSYGAYVLQHHQVNPKTNYIVYILNVML